MPYDHPNYLVRQEQSLPETTAGNGTVGAKFMRFQKFRLKSVSVRVTAAGTSTSPGSAFTVSVLSAGTATTTTSVGLLAMGTVAVGGLVTATINALVASGDQVQLTNGTDATCKGLPVYEYEILSDAVQTA